MIDAPRPRQEIEARQHENQQRHAYDDELRGHLQVAVLIASEAVLVAAQSARRIDSGMTVVAKKGAATEQAADLARRVLALREACEATKVRRLSSLKASLAQSEATEAARLALVGESEASARAAEAEAHVPHYLGRRR